jgi:alcohol dehydrogenase, propanol-preferring
MRAAVLREFGAPLALEERPEPTPQGQEVLVRVLGAGVCHSDLHIAGGRHPELPLPLVLGHEVAGEFPELGNVLVYASWGCGSCRFCLGGDEQLCPDAAPAGWRRDGGFAELVLVPSRSYLVPLEGLDPVRAAPLADAGVTPFRAVSRLREALSVGETAVVIGLGALGQFAVQYLRLLNDARVVAVDPVEAKRAHALELGAEEALPPEGLEEQARVVLDFVGSDETLALAARVVEPTGLVVLVGEAGGTLSFSFGTVPFEASFTTSAWGSQADLAAVHRLARRGEIEWDVETLPLEQANDALERLRNGDVRGRLVLTP